MRDRFIPLLAILGAIASLCLGSSLAKQLFPAVGPSGATALRVGFSALVLIAFWRPWRYPALTRADRIRILLYGAVLGLMNWMFYQSIRTIPFGLAVAIELLGPLSVALFSSRRAIDFMWLAFAAAGLSLLLPIFGTGDPLDPGGMLWALGAAVCWASYIVVGKDAQHLPNGQIVSFGLLVAALVVVPIGVASAGMALLEPRHLLIGLVVGIVSSAIPYSLEFVAIKRLPRETFGIMASLEPAVAALIGWLVLAEALSVRQLLAIAIVMAASIGAVLTANAARANVRPETTLQ